MDMLINIGLLTFGFIGALTAFGGDTWEKSDKPLLQRITTRGRLSIVCLALALIFGTTKEILSSYTSQKEAEKRANLEHQLQLNKEQLEAANKKLQEMASRVVAIPRQSYSTGFQIHPYGGVVLERPLYGGDKFEYSGNCSNLGLKVGRRVYHLDNSRPIIIVGPKGVPMEAAIMNPTDQDCTIKINVYSIEPSPKNLSLNLTLSPTNDRARKVKH